MNADRNLLFGILAFQNNFIDHHDLIASFDRWSRGGGTPFERYLVDGGQLSHGDCALIAPLVDRQLERHCQDAEECLASLEATISTRELLSQLTGGQPVASLAATGQRQSAVMPRSDPYATIPPDASDQSFLGPSAGFVARFRKLRPHAKGGLGEVYLAEDGELHRQVALKQMQEQHADDNAKRARFIAEAEITGGLEHPGIVPVYGLGTYPDGRPFYAMRFIRGNNLHEAIQEFHFKARANAAHSRTDRPIAAGDTVDSAAPTGGETVTAKQLAPSAIDRQAFSSLEFRKLLGRFIDVCNAIEYAHSRGVIHRDLKPGNIMLGKFGETLVVDWGLAKPLGQRDLGKVLPDDPNGSSSVDETTSERPLRLVRGAAGPATAQHTPLGTPQYMSPEQAAGKIDELGPASDVYSLGATFYSLLIGRPPVAARDLRTILADVHEGKFPPARQVNRHVPAALNAICLKAMASEPLDRYASARALADDVEHWLADESVSALAETAVERLARWGRKHRSWVRAGVAAIVVVAAVSGVALVLVDQARRATDNALVAETKAKGVAEARETQAIEAVKRFRDAVANERELKNSQQLVELRKRLLNEPLAFFKELRNQLQSDNDTRSDSLARLAGASFDLGLLTEDIGDKQDALIAYRESLAIWQKLAEAIPTSTEYQSKFANCYNNIGIVLSATGKPAEALAAYERALAIQERLAQENPNVTVLQRDLARSQNNLGNVLRAIGKPAEALAAFEAALTIRQKLADDNPTDTEFQSDLALIHNNIGVLLRATGKPGEALVAFLSALAIRQTLADDNPNVTQIQSDLATSHNNIGVLLKETGQLAEALAAYESALPIQKTLADDNPTVTEFQSDLARTHNNIANMLAATGKPGKALAAYDSALALWQKLADENPTDTDYRRDLARSHNNLGVLLAATGKAAEALAAYQSALTIRQKLADDNPTVTEFQSDLAGSHNNIGIFWGSNGKPAEALAAYESALVIWQKLADDNPTVSEYQSKLAVSYNNIGVVLKDTGKLAKALAAYESALPIQKALADDNPTVTDYRRDLGRSHINIGALLRATGKPAEAVAAYELALAISQELVRKHPASPDFASDLGGTLHNLANLDLDAKQFEEAGVRLRQAVEWQRKALAANPANPLYRRLLANHLINLIQVARELGDSKGAAESEFELSEVRDSDPAFAALDARLEGFVKGDRPPADESERLALAQRAYDKALFATAAWLWLEALEANPELADNRQTQHRYNAACSAALAAAGHGRDVPPPDDAATAKLRQQALGWLKADLAAWTSLLATADGPLRASVARTLEHWQQDSDLAGIRDSDALAKLPDDDRESLSELWTDVAALRQRAEAARGRTSSHKRPSGFFAAE